jgi:phage protein D
LKVDAQSDVTANAQLIGMEMRESEGGLTSMELRFSNFGTFSNGSASLVFENDSVLKLGAQIEVFAGDQSSQTSIFKGRISALEGLYSPENPPELTVLAEDALYAARLKRRSKVYENASPADLVMAIAQNNGLQPKTTGLSGNASTHVQFNESDLAFLRRVLARYDGDFQVVDNELQAGERSSIQRNQIEISLGEKLRRARVLADLAHQATKIQSYGWDYHQGSVASATSSAAVPGPGSGNAGSQILQYTFGVRTEQLANLSVRDRSEAQAVADAEWQQRSRKFVTLHGTSEGNPALRVGSHLSVKGLGARFSNTYYVVATVHRYDQEKGYETDFIAECAYLGAGR